MAVTGRLADIAQKSAVLFLAGTTGKKVFVPVSQMISFFLTRIFSLLHG